MIKVFFNSVEITNNLKNAINVPYLGTLAIGSNTLEVRSKKPLSNLYLDLSSTHDGALDFKYFDGSSLVSLSDFNDATAGLKLPGAFSWVNASDNAEDSGFYRYVFELNSVTASAALNIKFVGMVFSEDFDLKEDYPGVTEYLPSPDSTFIRFHVAAKNDIVAYFRQRGKRVFNTEARDLTEFDFLSPDQLRQGSKYLALSKIFFMASDAVEDKYYEMYKDYKEQAYKSLDLYYLTLDSNGDGKIDRGESVEIQPLVIVRA